MQLFAILYFICYNINNDVYVVRVVYPQFVSKVHTFLKCTLFTFGIKYVKCIFLPPP